MSMTTIQSTMGSMVQALVNSSAQTQNEVENAVAVSTEFRNEANALNAQLIRTIEQLQLQNADLQSQLKILDATRNTNEKALNDRIKLLTNESANIPK